MTPREDRLSELCDKQDLAELTFRLCRALDRGDLEGIRSCYHPDGRDDHGPLVCTPAEFAEQITAIMLDDGIWHHAMAQQLFELHGDTAYGESYYTFHSANPSGRGMSCFGRYLDHFERRNGEWRILRRCVTVDWRGQVSAETIPSDEFLPSRPDRNDPVYDIAKAVTRPVPYTTTT